MRICHVVGDSAFGGGSRMVMSLASAARDDGHDVRVLATAPAFKAALQRAGIPCTSLECIWRPIRPHRDLIGLARLWHWLHAESFDLVHTHTSKAGFVGRLAARLAGVPAVVHTVHGFAFHEASSGTRIAVYAGLERCAAHWCDRVVTVSEHHRAWALRLGIGKPAQVVAIPNGIDAPATIPVEAVRAMRRSLGVGDGEIVILSAGRLAPEKGIEDLLDACGLMAGSFGLRPWLWLAGEGPLLGALQARARSLGVESATRFLGFRDDVALLLASADIVALPSLREGLSIALLEAMAAGRPVVATDLPSNLEASAGGEVACLVPRRSAPRLAAALTALVRDPIGRHALGQAGRDRWESAYTAQRMLDAYRGLYAEVAPVGGRSRPTV